MAANLSEGSNDPFLLKENLSDIRSGNTDLKTHVFEHKSDSQQPITLIEGLSS